MSEGGAQGGNVRFQGANVRPADVLVLSTEIVAVDLVLHYTTVERIVDHCTKFITHWSL